MVFGEDASMSRLPEIELRAPSADDEFLFLTAARMSIDLDRPWYMAPGTSEEFHAYLERCNSPTHEGFLIIEAGLRAVVGDAFGPMGLHRLEASVQPGNTDSVALIRNIGFRHEGHSPRYLQVDGGWRDHDRFAITAEEWPAAQV